MVQGDKWQKDDKEKAHDKGAGVYLQQVSERQRVHG